MLDLVPPHDHGEERCLLVPPTADGHPEHGPGDAALGGADLGLVGEVAGEADARLGHGVPLSLPGRAVCPALGPGGRWTPWHAERAPGASGEANEVGPTGSTAGYRSARVPAWLVGRLRLGVGHAIYRPASSLHPGRGGRSRLPPRGPLAGPSQASAGHARRASRPPGEG